MNLEKLNDLEARVAKIERELDSAVKSLHRSIPLTVIDQVPTRDYPTYTQQQLWFFQAEITRWRNTNSRQPGFAICSFLPGVPLHPLVFLPISLVIKILEKMSGEVYETAGACKLIEETYDVKRQIQSSKGTLPVKKRLINLPKGKKPLA